MLRLYKVNDTRDMTSFGVWVDGGKRLATSVPYLTVLS